jgi:hypothetical protein
MLIRLPFESPSIRRLEYLTPYSNRIPGWRNVSFAHRRRCIKLPPTLSMLFLGTRRPPVINVLEFECETFHSLLKRRRSLHVNVRFKKSMWMFKWYMNIMFIYDSLLPRIQCPFSHVHRTYKKHTHTLVCCIQSPYG